MLKWITPVLVAAAFTAGATQAQPVKWEFVGSVTNGPETPEFGAYIDYESPVRGTLVFEPSTPGHRDCYLGYCSGSFNLPGAVFDAQVGSLSFHGIGATALIWASGDGFTFTGKLDSSSYPEGPFGGTWEIYVDAMPVGLHYGPDHLPWLPPMCREEGCPDEAFSMYMRVGEVGEYHEPVLTDEVGAYYMFSVRGALPEPSPLAIYFGLGVILISMRRFFGSRPSATRKFVAPSP